MKETTTMTDLSLDDPDVVVFAGVPPAPAPGEFVTHSLKDKLFGRRMEDVKLDWTKISGQISELVAATSEAEQSGFSVESIEVSLGFTASGKIAFIAEAGVEASVALTLTRG
jgi:hypothetical protein